MTNPPIQRIAFADLGEIIAYDDFSAGSTGNCSCVVGAIVRHNQKSVTGGQLRFDVCNRW